MVGKVRDSTKKGVFKVCSSCETCGIALEREREREWMDEVLHMCRFP